MLPDRWLLLGAALLGLGALMGVGMLLLPRGHKLRQGFMPIVPQLFASAGAGSAVWGWYVARKLLQQWHMTETPPVAALRDSIDRVIDWKEQLGLLLPAILLGGLILSALPIWRGGIREKSG